MVQFRPISFLSNGFSMHRAFTLIEVLVVVAIIALLIAILLPVLSNAKYVARTAECASQLRQMGVAAISYSIDNDGFYPHKMDPGSTAVRNTLDGKLYRSEFNVTAVREQGTIKYNYIPLLDPYVANTDEIFICPHTGDLWGEGYGSSTNSQIISYAMYWGITGSVGNGHVRIPQTRLGEGFGPDKWLLQNGRFTHDSRFRILAGDFVAWDRVRKLIYGNHPPTAGGYEELGTANASPLAYKYQDTTPGNANYLYDDGSVQLYGQIFLSNIGRDPEDLFGFAGDRWLAPTDRVDP